MTVVVNKQSTMTLMTPKLDMYRCLLLDYVIIIYINTYYI